MSIPGTPETILAVERLTVRYSRATVLEDVSLAVPRGAVYVLLGRNGAGKSSLVRCALGLQKPGSGTARLFGADAWRTRGQAMARVGVLPEDPDAPPEMTAREISAFCGRLHAGWDEEGVRRRLTRVAVPLDLPFRRLSKGQKAAVMLALCLAPRPELLVLDDPTLGLDAVARRTLYDELIGDLADRGVTVFLTTHDLAGIEGLATHVAILKGSRVVVEGELDTLKARFRRIRRGAAPQNDGETWAPFTAVSNRVREWGADAVVSNFAPEALERFTARPGVTGVEVEAVSLEEVFVALTGDVEGAA